MTPASDATGSADLAAALQDYRLATLLGQETGGLASSYGEFMRSALPHTGLRLNVSYKYFVRPNGLEDGRGVIPEMLLPEVRGAADSDSALDRVLELLEPSCVPQAGGG
jgi:C-terminal processing protease CtpA/Prc